MTWGDRAATNVGDGGWDLRCRRRRGCRQGGGGCYLAREGWGRGYWEGTHAGVRVHVRLPCVSAGCCERGGGRLRGLVRVRLRLLTVDAAEEDVVGANEGGFVGFSAIDVAEGAVTCHQWSVG